MRSHIHSLLFVVAVAAFPAAAFAHGDAEGGMMMGGPSGMHATQMMGIMHEQLDQNASVACANMSDDMLMERGESMMEKIMGEEDHARVEAAMNSDDHNAMHAMMGMMATGCFGNDVSAALANRLGLTKSAPQPRTGSGGMFAIGLVGGLALGFLGAGFMRRRSPVVPPATPQA